MNYDGIRSRILRFAVIVAIFSVFSVAQIASAQTATDTPIMATSSYHFVFEHYGTNDTDAQMLDIAEILLIIAGWSLVGWATYKGTKTLLS